MKKVVKYFLIFSLLVVSSPVLAHPPAPPCDAPPPPPPPPPIVPVATYSTQYQQPFDGCEEHYLLITEITTEYSDNTASTSRLYSVVNKDGAMLVENVKSVEHLNNDYEHYFLIYANGRYEIIDSYGAMTSPELFTSAKMAAYDRIIVSKSLSAFKTGYGVVDYSGKVIVPLKYQTMNYGKFNNGLYMTKLNGYWGLSSLDNEIFAKNENDSIKEFLSTYRLKKEGKFGLLGFDGHKILDTIYDSIDTLGSEYIVVKSGKKYALYDAYGNSLSPFRYKKIKMERNSVVGNTGITWETIVQ